MNLLGARSIGVAQSVDRVLTMEASYLASVITGKQVAMVFESSPPTERETAVRRPASMKTASRADAILCAAEFAKITRRSPSTIKKA